MIYMSRLGIWGEGTPFRTFEDFLHAIEKRYVRGNTHLCLQAPMSHKGFLFHGSISEILYFGLCRGVGAMEIVAMDMKVSGMYIARQLSFSGVSFRIEEIGLDSDFKQVYNKAAKLVSLRPFPKALLVLFSFFKQKKNKPHLNCVSSGRRLCKRSCEQLTSWVWSAGSLCGGSSGQLTSASSSISALLPRSAAWWSWPERSWRQERSAPHLCPTCTVSNQAEELPTPLILLPCGLDEGGGVRS